MPVVTNYVLSHGGRARDAEAFREGSNSWRWQRLNKAFWKEKNVDRPPGALGFKVWKLESGNSRRKVSLGSRREGLSREELFVLGI